MNNVQTPAEQLRAWRAYCRLTTAQVSQRTGIPEATLYAIEEGRMYPDAQLADRLNQFFSQYPAQQQATQAYTQAVSYPGTVQQQVPSYPNAGGQRVQSYPEAGTHYTQSYPGAATQYTQSYPGAATQYTQSYPGAATQYTQSNPGAVTQYTQSNPGAVTQVYPMAQPVTQQAIYPSQVVPAAVPTQYYLQPRQTTGYLGLTPLGAVFLLIFLIVPIVFMFFPFMDLIAGVSVAGITVDSQIATQVTGVSALAYTYYEFAFSAIATQVGLWLTLVGALALIVFCILRIFGFDLFAVRTVFFYILLFGVIISFIGLCVTTIHEVTRWAYIAFALSSLVAVVFRMVLDGGMRSFVIVQ